MSKIKCFHYHELGQYATNCPYKKVDKNPSGRAAGEALASQFKLDFTLITCMVTPVMDSEWYLDSGASSHMTYNKEFLCDLEERDLHMHNDMGDEGRYSVHRYGYISEGVWFSSHIKICHVCS